MKNLFKLSVLALLGSMIYSCSRENENELNHANTISSNFSSRISDNSDGIIYSDGTIYRIRDSGNNDHLYTLNPNEVVLHATNPNSNWYLEGTIGRTGGNNSALKRWYNPSNGDRLLTTTNEVANNSSWVLEGNLGNTYYSTDQNVHPVYRYAKRNGGKHFFTHDFSELGNGNSYWRYEGVFFYLVY